MDNKPDLSFKEMTATEYLLAFADFRSSYSDLCVRQASEYGKLYCCKAGNQYAGYLCSFYEENAERILYAFTKPDFRMNGVFASAIDHVLKTSDRDVKISLLETHQFYPAVEKVCRLFQFEQTEELRVFSMERSSRTDDWVRIKERQRFSAYCDILLKNGYEVFSFSEASDDVIEQIKNSHYSDFKNGFDPSVYFKNKAKNLARDYSFAAVKDGKLVAYVLIVQPSSDSLVFEQMATASDFMNSGAFLLPYVASLDCFFNGDFKYYSFATYPSNTPANKVRERLERETTFDVNTVRNYIKRKTETSA